MPAHREAGDGNPLAPERPRLVLEPEISGREDRTPSDRRGDHRADQGHVERQRDLGIAADPVRAALLGHKVAKSTIERYMVKRPKEPSQAWRTFLRNHMSVSAACDFFVGPSITFKMLCVFIVMSHDSRRILHLNATKHPTAEWAAQQLVEAFPGDQPVPRFRDRD